MSSLSVRCSSTSLNHVGETEHGKISTTDGNGALYSVAKGTCKRPFALSIRSHVGETRRKERIGERTALLDAAKANTLLFTQGGIHSCFSLSLFF